MVRVFGEGSDKMLDREEELNIMTQVQEDYVKLKFENGIIVQFFAGNCLRPPDLLDEDKQEKIIEQMIHLHKITLLERDGSVLQHDWFDRVEKWIGISKRKNFLLIFKNP